MNQNQIEKFGYYITTNYKIKIYRVIGSDNINSKGRSYFKIDFTEVPNSYKSTIEYKIAPPDFDNWWSEKNKNKKLYNTKDECIIEAKKELDKLINDNIIICKNKLQYYYDCLLDMKNDSKLIKYKNCGGK